MHFDLDAHTASLSVGEFADFTLGPRDATGGPQGIWRAQLGTQWHRQLQERTAATHPAATFEVPIQGRVFHRGWTLTLTGRIDQLVPTAEGTILREIKTITRPLPADEAELRAEFPSYFVQLATYAALRRIEGSAKPVDNAASRPASLRPELVFVELASGLAQTVVLTAADDVWFRTQLERIGEFLAVRQRARERLRHLRFRPPFAVFRPGQETAVADLLAAIQQGRAAILLEAPTGFGKTGVLLEAALTHLRAGHFERVLYLTSKATGQLQVARTLAVMTGPAAAASVPDEGHTPVAVWLVRPKSEHCVNTTFHCVRDSCAYLADAETRWPRSGLARFYLDENEARDLPTLRAAGVEARICPYEITRAALGFNDVWIGDYNYVFAPANRGLFFEQPGFDPARTLLIVDEAHNLPPRVADSYSHVFAATAAAAVRDELHRLHAPMPLVQAWEHWTHFLEHLKHHDALPLADEDDARHLLEQVARLVTTVPLDYAALGPDASAGLWAVAALHDDLANNATLSRHWWSPRAGELAISCLDAAPAIGAALREFGGVILASATFGPEGEYAQSIGLAESALPAPTSPPLPASAPERLGQLTKRDTRKLFKQVTSAAELLKIEEARAAAAVACLRAGTPWREHAYDVAYDLRVDTTFQHRARHFATTAATITALCNAARQRLSAAPQSPATPDCGQAVVAFFPSYAYAEAIRHELEAQGSPVRVALQQRLKDLGAQAEWVEASLTAADVLFLVLGSSFAESIDALGGRVSHALVAGPALPEVNAVQHARMAALSSLGREAAFRRVYQIPGMQKVNQALGRLVRAPGQRARVLLHCRRFAEPSYSELLADDYKRGQALSDDAALTAWLTSNATAETPPPLASH
ncbi:MAG: DEAD/DEAH box helicase family protein [Opitutae bacterium]|nr:DEAD/DEAH box helicase family protein [Opitutae bacterium]